MSGCTLCDLGLPADPVTDAAVDGEYCCRGCLEVARALDDADPAATDPEAVERETAVADADGEVAYLSVDGMHCSTCEVFLESTATDCDGIEAAAASYATDTMQVVYDDEALTLRTDDPETVTEVPHAAALSTHLGDRPPMSMHIFNQVATHVRRITYPRQGVERSTGKMEARYVHMQRTSMSHAITPCTSSAHKKES